MWPLERETALPVQISYIFNNPRVCGVTPRTIISHRLAMHICMTAEAIRLRFRKNKGGMAHPAIYRKMLSLKREIGAVVIEGIDLTIKLPSLRTVAYIAAFFKFTPMG